MKRLRCVRIIVLLLCMSGLTKGFSQSTMGTDFWVTFLPNYSDSNITLSLIMASSTPCSGTITNPRTNWDTTFTVNVGATTIVPIPKPQAYNYEGSDCVMNTALHVVATDTISLYSSNFRMNSFDVTDVLPTQSLGSEYLIQTYTTHSTSKGPADDEIEGGKWFDQDRSMFAVVATEDNTNVSFNLNCNSLNGHVANQTFSVTLNAGQCYQLLSADSVNFSGSRVVAAGDKKIAVFAGNLCTRIPMECGNCDHIVEQMLPSTCWGQHFVVTNSKLRTKDIIRITALNNGCQIRKNGAYLATISARQTYQFEITSGSPSAYIETSQPAMAFLYLTGSQYGGTNGDPSMVLISPIEQRINYVTFSTFNSGTSEYHYVNIVTDVDQVSGMKLDGNSIASEFHTVTGNSDYAFARVEVEHGSHTLYNPSGSFVAHVYGLGYNESYAYSVGSMAINLTVSQMVVNGQLTSAFPNGFNLCKDDEAEFDLSVSFTPSRTEWDFGDGQTGTGFPLNHTYTQSGNYQVSCAVYKMEDGIEVLISTLTTIIHVGQTSQTEVSETHCESFTWHGTTYTESGVYEYLDQSINGCDSLVTLHLTISQNETNHLNITSCDSYEWYGNTYTESGTYEYHEQTVAGCDSLLVLHLELGENFNSEEEVVACDSYSWRGQTYTESGTYTDLVHAETGCDSTFILKLTMGHNTYMDTTVSVCDEFQWHGHTYLESGDYVQSFQTEAGCDSVFTLHLTIGNIVQIEENVTACDSYTWMGHVYTEGGVYHEVIPQPDGCDSLFTLNLMMGHEQVHPVETEVTCEDFFNWHGHYYTQNGVYYDTLTDLAGCYEIYMLDLTFEDGYSATYHETVCDQYPWSSAPGGFLTSSGFYQYEGETAEGCDSILSLYLTVNHTPDLMIHGLTQVAMSTDLWPGVYNYCVADSTELGSCTVTWTCSNPDWILMPSDNPYWCRLIAKSLGKGTLTAFTTCDTGCDATYSLEINASYFDVEENLPDRVSLYPNPAQTQVTVEATQLTGIRMYDSYGQKVKELACDPLNTMAVEVGDLRPGIYLVEVVTAGGTVVRRLVINR